MQSFNSSGGSSRTARLVFGLLFLWAGAASAQPTAYVATYGDSPAFSSQIAAVNLTALTTPQYIGVGSMPFGVAIHPALPSVYVSHSGAPSLSVINSSTNVVIATVDLSSCPTLGNPSGVVVSPDGSKVYAGGAGGGIFVIDTASNTLANCIPLAQGISGVAVSPDGSRVYAAGYSLLYSVDPVTGTTSTATLPFSTYVRPVVASPDGQRVYVPASQPSEILVFQTDDLTAPMRVVPVPPGPTGLALTKDGGKLYVTNVDPPTTLTEVDTQTFTARQPLSVIAASTGGVSRSMDVPVGVAVSADGSRVYIASATPHYPGSDGDLFVIDATTPRVISRIVVDNVRDTLGQFVTWNLPPVANAGLDQTLECAGPGGASVVLDASNSTDPDGDPLTYAWTGPFGTRAGQTLPVTLPLGVSTVSLTVTDPGGLFSTVTIRITVTDTTPPTLTVSVAPQSLRPANHSLTGIVASVSAHDVCDPGPRVTLMSVLSSEPDNGLGDGDTPNDIQGAVIGTDDRTFLLRAERSAQGPGRVYTIVYSATDQSGNAATASAQVLVPKDQGQP